MADEANIGGVTGWKGHGGGGQLVQGWMVAGGVVGRVVSGVVAGVIGW